MWDGQTFLIQLLDELELAVVAFDPDGHVSHWNRGAQRLLGRSRAEATGRAVTEVAAPPHERPVAQKIIDGQLGGASWSGDLLSMHEDGTRILLHITATPVRDPAGVVLGGIWVLEEAAARQHAEQGTALLSTLFEHSPVHLAILDNDLRVSQTTSTEDVGRPLTDMLGTAAGTVAPLFQHVLDTGEPLSEIEVWLGEPDRRCLLSSYYRLQDAERRPIGVGGVFVDITERKRTVQATARVTERLALLTRAGRLLREATDPVQALGVLVAVPVPGFADRVLLDVATADGTLTRLRPGPAGWRAAAPIGYPSAHPALASMQYGEGLSADLARFPDPLAEGGPGQALWQPLRADGQTVGVATFVRREPFDAVDVGVAGDFATRLAHCVLGARRGFSTWPG